MLQELFRIPFLDLPIYGYGLMLVVGFLLATQWAQFLARRSAIDPEAFVTASLIMLVAGVAGARISHILENPSHFTQGTLWENIKNMANIRSGGLTYYGGFILATACSIAYAIKKGIPLLRGMDIIAPCLMIGLAFGRIGCFLNGCCFGAECNLPWAVEFPYHSAAYVEQWEQGRLHQKPPPELLVEVKDPVRGPSEKLLEPRYLAGDAAAKSSADHAVSNPVHPTQLYSAVTAFMLAVLLSAYYTLPHAAGRVFALMLMLEGGTRFLLEMIRVEPAVIGPASRSDHALLQAMPNMSLSMIIGLALVVCGMVMWFWTKGPPDELAYQGQPEPAPALAS